MPETFGIDVEINPAKAEAGAKKVETALAGVETKAKETGDLVGDALAKGFDDAARDAVKALRQMQQEEKEWADAAATAHRRVKDDAEKVAAAFGALERATLKAVRAEHEYAEAERIASAAVKAGAATEAQARAVLEEKAKALEHVGAVQREAASGIEAYDKALKSATASIPKATDSLSSLWGGLKNVGQSVAAVGDAFGKVRMALDLVTKGFETSKEAARAAIAAWRSMDNSGPSAYVGGDYARTRRMNLVNEQYGRIGETYTSIDSLPKEIADAIKNAAIDDQDLERLVKQRVDEVLGRRAAIAKDYADLQSANAASRALAELGSRPERLAAFEKEDAEITRLMERQIAARERIVARGGEITRKMLQDEAALDARAAAHNERVRGDVLYASRPDLTVDDRSDVASRYDRRTAATAKQIEAATAAGTFYSDVLQDLHDLAAVLRERRQIGLDLQVARLLRDDRDAVRGDSSLDFAGKIAAGQALTGRTYAGRGLSFAEKLASGQGFKDATADAEKFAAALEGPVGGAVDGLIDGLVKWDMGWKEWASSALEAIARVMAQLLLLQGVQYLFNHGSIGGKTANFLSHVLGAGDVTPTARYNIGDPFGGAAGTSGAIWREPVQRQAPGGGGAGSSPIVNVKSIVVADMRALALEAMQSAEGERIMVTHVSRNQGKLGAGGR